MKTPLYLIGFMGAGKSTVGRLLAKKLGCDFVDLDEEIVKRHHCSIRDIFRQQGEAVFRRYESQLLHDLSQRTALVVSTGGGVVGAPENWRVMEATGKIIFLSCPWEILVHRLQGSSERPLVNQNDVATLKALYDKRQELYQKAPLRIHTEGLSAAEVAEKIQQCVSKDVTWNS